MTRQPAAKSVIPSLVDRMTSGHNAVRIWLHKDVQQQKIHVGFDRASLIDTYPILHTISVELFTTL